MSALSDKEQRDLYNRVMGFQRQRWYVVETGTLKGVPEGTPGALPAVALDTLDGNWLTQIITGGNAHLAEVIDTAIRNALTGVGPVDANAIAEQVRTAVAAKLAALRFNVTT